MQNNDTTCEGDRTAFSFCRNCSAGCGVKFEITGDTIQSHVPDRLNPFSSGFMCIKGNMAVEFMQGGEGRLRECFVKRGEEWKAISPALASDEIAARFGAIIELHGPSAAALYYGTSAYGRALTLPIAKSFCSTLGIKKIFSTMSIDQSARYIASGRMGIFATGKRTIFDTDVLLLSGTNPVVSHWPGMGVLPTNNQVKNIRNLKVRGGKLIVIDPRATETARMANLHIQPRPGFDAAIFASLIHILLKERLYDAAFCARHITNLDVLRDTVEPFEPHKVAALAGIDPAQLYEAARCLAHPRRVSVDFGTGTTMATFGDKAVHFAEALNALCGGYVRAGDEVRYPGVFAKRGLQEQVYPPNRMWEQEPKLRSGFGRLYGEYPTSRLADDILQPGDGQIRVLFVLGANPLATWGEPERARQALEQLDLLVVIDPRMTETADVADYVIAPPLQYEVHDFGMPFDFSVHTPFLQYSPPVMSPPEGTIEEWKFFNGIANRLGQKIKAKPFIFGVDFDSIPGGMDLDPTENWTSDRLIAWYCEQAGISFADLCDHPHGMILELGKPIVTMPKEDDGNRLDICPEDFSREIAELPWDVSDRELPYRLINRRSVEAMNTAYRFNAQTVRRGVNRLHMNPEDLKRDGIADNDMVEIAGRHGSLTATVKADSSLLPGVVSIPHGWNVSALISMRIEDVQPIDGMPVQSNIPVHISRISEPRSVVSAGQARNISDQGRRSGSKYE
ncbi:Anaerobic selenocysteine-containing dehydrogenase [Sphingobium faniae]|nr:Anaerobic selenocysteine-containing dehydrogenase [Sphingobium faniae]